MSKRIFAFGAIKIDAQAYGSQGNAVLGIRDSGKTYTATELAEHLFEAGVPFVTFDPTGVWRYLRVPGKGRGYPVVVAGGRGADLPLTVTGAVEIVRAAMKNGVSLVLDLTDPNLSKSDWKRIVKSCVRVLLQENAPHGLRHVFIEEAAEFVPQRVLDGDVYAEVEKLARIGGNSRLGYTLINQRSQEVNKAVLELCENLFLHRQRGKNAIQSLDHWLGIAGVDQAALVKSLPMLPSGQCWAWMGDRAAPTLITVPPKNSFHPDRRTMHGAKGKRGRKAVDVGSFVKDMRSALVQLEAEAAANDPAKLKVEIASLKAEKAKLQTQVTTAATAKKPPDKNVLDAIKQAAIRDAKKHFAPLLLAMGEAMRFIVKINAKDFFNAGGEALDQEQVRKAILAGMQHVEKLIQAHVANREKQIDALRLEAQRLAAKLKTLVDKAGAPFAVSPPLPPKSAPSARPAGDSAAEPAYLTPTKRAILDALAWLESIGEYRPSRVTAAFLAGSSSKSSTFEKYVSALNQEDLIFYPSKGSLALTDSGRAFATAPEIALDHRSLMEKIRRKLTPGQMKLLSAAAAAYPNTVSRDELAAAANMSAASSTFEKYVSQIKSFGLLSYPDRGHVRADDRLFPRAA